MSSSRTSCARQGRRHASFGRWGVALLCVALAIGVSIAGTTRYQYDELGRLVRVELPNGNMIEYVYDAAGNIVSTRDPILDDDGDGVPDIDDCAPLDGDVYTGAPEINDGKDNQCPGDAGFGLVDEVTGPLAFDSRTTVSWPAQAGATMYEVGRSSDMTFATKCWEAYTPQSTLDVTLDPPSGVVHGYLVRTFMPYAGSWGAYAGGAERAGVCP